MPALAQNASAKARSYVVLKVSSSNNPLPFTKLRGAKASSSGLRPATHTTRPLDRPGKATICETLPLTRLTDLF
jgi:hypothetical protein